VLAIVAASLLPASATAEDAAWDFSIAPYLWVPHVNGTLRYDMPSGAPGSFDVNVGADDYLDNLDMAFLFAVEARRHRWAAAMDFMYLDLSGQSSTVESIDFTAGRVPVSAEIDAGSETRLKGLIWSLNAGYEAVMSDRGNLITFVGVRYFGLEATTDWQLTATISPPGGSETFPKSGTASGIADAWAALVGVRGRLLIGDGTWFVPWYLDVGTGSSHLTWQGVAGIAYAFNSIDLALLYRHLYYGAREDDALVQDLTYSGPAFGAVFRF